MDLILPDSFLGGSARRLRSLSLDRITFPNLPKLLLSATHLVDLQLHDIPHSGYFSPEALVTSLSTLPSFRLLHLEFESHRSRPILESRRPPATRSLLPVLNTLRFHGNSKYLDDLVAHIDAPRLNKLDVTFFKQNAFDTVQLIQFISRTPTLNTLKVPPCCLSG
jgi:hypothetical protein